VDLCALVGAELLAQLVPGAGRRHSTADTYHDTFSGGYCYSRTFAQPGTAGTGELEVQLWRFGSRPYWRHGERSAAGHARAEVVDRCRSWRQGLRADSTRVDQASCLVAVVDGVGAVVRYAASRGPDVVSVSYLAYPAEPHRAAEAAAAVAGNVLGRL
jgi:hypothetical protein